MDKCKRYGCENRVIKYAGYGGYCCHSCRNADIYETEIADLQKQLAEAQARLEGYKVLIAHHKEHHEKERTQLEWVSVEILPEDYGLLWIDGNDGVEAGYYDLERNVYRDYNGHTINSPTHYIKMITPQPPKDK